MPRFKVDRESTFALATTLVDVACSVVVDLEHGDEAIAVAISAADVRTAGPDAVHCDADSTSVLGNHSRLLQGIIDALDTILAHGKKEARGHLRFLRARVEKRRCGMSKPLL